METRKLSYDFSEFEKILFNIKANPTPNLLVRLKNELNDFFRDSKCKEVIYTNNSDKLFFGMAVIPMINGNDIYDIIQDDRPYRVNEYYLELDSKLFGEMLNLNSKELTAVLLHEVGHMVNDSSPMEKVRTELDTYLASNKESIVMSKSIHYKEILTYGIKDALRKLTSVFECNDDEIIADEFVYRCGYGEHLESAFRKICRNGYNINKDVDNKIIVLSWTLRLYKDIRIRRIAAIKTLNKGKSLTPSKLEKKEMDNVIRRLERIDDDALLESAIAEIQDKYYTAIRQLKYKGIRGLEDDLYEYNLRIKNLETEADALLILRQVNSKISIIDDYIATENLDDHEKKRWSNLINKYEMVREELSKKALYQNKTRIYINYPTV